MRLCALVRLQVESQGQTGGQQTRWSNRQLEIGYRVVRDTIVNNARLNRASAVPFSSKEGHKFAIINLKKCMNCSDGMDGSWIPESLSLVHPASRKVILGDFYYAGAG